MGFFTEISLGNDEDFGFPQYGLDIFSKIESIYLGYGWEKIVKEYPMEEFFPGRVFVFYGSTSCEYESKQQILDT
jgi:hypothetical protein